MTEPPPPLGGVATKAVSPSWSAADFSAPVPESLSQPARIFVPYEQIEGDPFNIRASLPSVLRMCWSIYQHGVLENLIVVEHPSLKRRAEGKLYQLRAGSRRFEAIGRLRDGVEPPPGHPDREAGRKWNWPLDRPVPVLVQGSHGHFEHLIENIERSDPHPWEVGRRIHEILSAGVSSRDLGSRLGRSNGWINRYAHIGEGLAPELIELLRQEKATPNLGELAQLATLRDAFGDPDGQKQIERYRERRARKRRRPRRQDPSSLRATMKRLHYLRNDMPVPSILRPVVDALTHYLEGGEPPGFRQLQEKVIDRVRELLPGSDPEGA